MVEPHSDDGVMAFKFSSPPAPPAAPYDSVIVTCDEGSSRFLFANPRSPGALVGCAEDAGGGRIILHNSENRDWHRCDVLKPDQTHYVLDKLTAGDRESIRGGVFVSAHLPPRATALSLRCIQGELTVSVN